MRHTDVELAGDIERIRQLSIIPTILEVVCQTTGMGFAAVARVTQDRWIAASVRDEIQFGLVPGGELAIETTICNEIRDDYQAVIIDHVQESDRYRNHHTPLMYGFQSYISFPIILKSGEFFGTLCAIDPKPALLTNSKVMGMFSLFTDLISFHLQQVELLERSQVAVHQLNQQLTESIDENRQYQHISDHNLQEPLRKLRVFSGMLMHATEKNDVDKAKELAARINSSAQRFSMMIKDLSNFSGLEEQSAFVEKVDLTKLIAEVVFQLIPQLKEKNGVIQVGDLPSLRGMPVQLEQLFYHLIHNAIKFSKPDEAPIITISSQELKPSQLGFAIQAGTGKWAELQIKDNGIGIEQSQLNVIFDLFSQLPQDKVMEGEGVGLAYCRKIIRNHSGKIKAQSERGKGTTISVFLPIE